MQFSCDSSSFIDARLESRIESLLHFLQAQQVERPQENQEHANANSTKPYRLIPGRQYLNAKRCSRFTPWTAAGGAFHDKRVGARRQSGVVGDALIAAHFVPLSVEPVQLIAISIRLGIEKTQCGELNREDVLPMRQGNGVRVSDR